MDASDAAIGQGILLVNDMAESQLLGSIRDGNLSAVSFWLKHHHPSYETRVELRQAVSLADENLSKAQKEAVLKALELFGEGKKYLGQGDDTSGE